MKHKSSISAETLKQQILSSASLSDSKKKELIEIAEGKRIAALTSDVMAKHLYSPDSHPERFDSIMQRILKDPTIKSNHSAANELPVEFRDSKTTISDISSWLTDGRFASLEFQQAAQDYSFNRFDLYSSRMLLFCYSSDEDHKKSEIDYDKATGVILVALMLKSPQFLKNSKSKRYIHRFTDVISDSGVRIPLLKKLVFVQLDKALEQFLNNTYNKRENYSLLVELAMLADANNQKVKEAVMKKSKLKNIYDDARRFSLSRDAQIALLQYEWAVSSQEYTYKKQTERAVSEAVAEAEPKAEARGENRINALYSWLHENHRDDDIWKATTDPEYRAKLLKEFDEVSRNSAESPDQTT